MNIQDSHREQPKSLGFSLEYQADPVVLGRRVVAQHCGMPVLLVDDDVDVAVIVQIAKGRPRPTWVVSK